ncbi:MAG: hypothetical protein GC154_04050 [bacterium]|nr:hypothetical protein [bacterium]
MKKRFAVYAVWLLLSLAVQPSPGWPQASDDELWSAFHAAVADASVAEPSDAVHDLIAITYSNPSLTWNDAFTPPRVLMITWTSWTGYGDYIGRRLRFTPTLMNTIRKRSASPHGAYLASRDVWVTAAPQLREFCVNHALAPQTLDLRLEQLLGLPPHNGKTLIVEFWVDPADLFRPAPDPSIDGVSSSFEFPPGVDPAYRDWFDSLKASSYGADGYPWTRLGYTYDWGGETEEGLSEFVIRMNAVVDVKAVYSTEEYCLPLSRTPHWALYR